jgi:enamine deaminase RidA (YjgF/YER057c/UK114 family)
MSRSISIAFASAFAVLVLALILGRDGEPAFAEPAFAAEQAAQVAQVAPTVEYLSPGGNFSEGVKVDGIIYLSGKLGTSRQGEQGIAAETTRALESIKTAFERYGSDMDHVIKCTVFLADIADFQAMNGAYVQAFPVNKPARSTVAVGGLVGGALIEIECMGAVK